jgi:FAD/FMN-containing dehydrogenase
MTAPGLYRTIAGWGRYPVVDTLVVRPATLAAMAQDMADAASTDLLVRGNGRSYGDASLNPRRVFDARGLDRLIDFDPHSGVLVCEAGVLLSEVIDAMLPRGWFPPVTPGTRFVTIGGMVASDVHGKNHHGAGSFCDHLLWVDVATGDGEVRRCAHDSHAELFAATCGGMGLTGAILACAFRMLPVETGMVRQRTVRAPTLAHALATFEEALDWTYSVAWIDCLAGERSAGRSAIMLGEHARADELPLARRATPLARPARRLKRVPVDLPGFVLSRASVSLFNRVYYAAQRPGDALVDIDPYFYPLDALADWNRIYGRRGFTQFQCVLPLEASQAGLGTMLRLIRNKGQASFLAVLKRLGGESFGLMSFPRPGYTLALDFPATPANLALMAELDAVTAAHGGRIYLAKDACASATTIAAGYPRLDMFRAVRRRYGLDTRFSSLLSERLGL